MSNQLGIALNDALKAQKEAETLLEEVLYGSITIIIEFRIIVFNY